MVYSVVHLKERFPFLGENGADPLLECYLPENMAEIGWEDKKHPCMLLIPGGGYRFVSRREAEPLALQLMPRGFNVFVLTYSVAPLAFPTQIREVAAALELIPGIVTGRRSPLWASPPAVISPPITAIAMIARRSGRYFRTVSRYGPVSWGIL